VTVPAAIRPVLRRRGRAPTVACAAAALLAAGCGAGAPPSNTTQRDALTRYLERVEPLRRGVNRLLAGADPILEGAHERTLPAATAARRMSRLERRFARVARTVGAIHSGWPALERLQRTYAGTYPLEDAYLRALAAALPGRAFGDLPQTQERQRRALVEWRVGITSLARRVGVGLPRDVDVAGRGEIAPSPEGS
jgi:hypothetical protein